MNRFMFVTKQPVYTLCSQSCDSRFAAIGAISYHQITGFKLKVCYGFTLLRPGQYELLAQQFKQLYAIVQPPVCTRAAWLTDDSCVNAFDPVIGQPLRAG